MSYHNIPDELKSLIQWCVWRYETPEGSTKPTKVPYHPLTGRHASSTDRQTWCSFEQATLAALDWNKWAGIGFFFSSRDPYCGIDLDDPYAMHDDGVTYIHADPAAVFARQQKIYAAVPGYAELSPSGKGLHIITKADVPHGRRRDGVEIYSVARFFTMTGNVKRAAPIGDSHEIVNTIWEQMSPPKSPDGGFMGNPVQEHDDAVIYDMAAKAANGDKFVALYNGDWREYYKSQSEADFALVDIIAFYSDNQIQIIRMFRDSALGKRAKAARDAYVWAMVTRSFDNRLAPVDFSGLLDKLNAATADLARSTTESASIASPQAAAVPSGAGQGAGVGLTGPAPALSFDTDYHLKHQPPGLLGMLVDYIMRSSPRPVYEIALVAALGLLSGIAGRQFNISKSGLNQYLMLVADTGKGKEAIGSAISTIIGQVADTVISMDGTLPVKHDAARLIRGPAEMASGQSLLKYLAVRGRPCFVSLTGEFGIKLQQLTTPNASPADTTLKKVLLDLFSKSGAGQSVEPSIYADREKNTEAINSPAFTLLGESTGETFYAALDEASVAQGLLPRFTIVEYDGPRPPYNDAHVDAVFPEQLRKAVSDLIAYCDELAHTNVTYNVPAQPDAAAYLSQINIYCDNQINSAKKEVLRQLWNRVHLKILRLSALLAVAHNYQTPMITRDMVHWAQSLIVRDTLNIIGRFDAGTMGVIDETDDRRKEERISVLVKDYLTKPFSELPRYGATVEMHKNATIPFGYIQRAVSSSAAFRKDRRGSIIAVQSSLKFMCDAGYLREIPVNQAEKDFKFAGKCYAIIHPKHFLTLE